MKSVEDVLSNLSQSMNKSPKFTHANLVGNESQQLLSIDSIQKPFNKDHGDGHSTEQ